jgi:hypothetical protein
MEFVKYKAIRGYYGGKEEIEITVPKSTKFLCRVDSIGHGLTDGHNHYMFFVKNSDITETEFDTMLDDAYYMSNYKLGDIHVFVIDNIKFVDEVPLYESYTIPMAEFGLNDMYIIHKTLDTWPKTTIDEIINGTVTMTEVNKAMIPGRVFSVSKILAIEGPYDITTFDVNLGTYFDERELYSMAVTNRVEIDQITEPFDALFNNKMYRLVATKDATEFERIKNKVLEQITQYKV